MEKSARMRSADVNVVRQAESVEAEADASVSTFSVFVAMEDLIDKLKLLDYESHFVKEFNTKPFPR